MIGTLHELAALKVQLAKLQPQAVADLRAKAVERLEELQLVGDKEAAHKEADQLLCGFLRAIGHQELADEFEAIERWYG